MSENQKFVIPVSPWASFKSSLFVTLKNKVRKYKCGRICLVRSIVSAFPILDWFVHYNIKKCLIGDVISGFTVGIMNIPQGMAYGVLAGTESIHGLYASFFPILMYCLVCTSQHAAVGTFAVTSLMAGGIVHSMGAELYAQSNASIRSDSTGNHTTDQTAIDPVPLELRVQVMVAVTLSVGLWQVLMGIFRFGYLAVFLSDHLVKGFTCAAAFHVFTSQIKLVFGMPHLQERYGPLKLIYFYYDFFAQITTVHVPTLIVSIICIAVLYLTKTFVNQNLRIMKVIKIPIPIELLVIIFATLASYYLDLARRWGVKTVEHIPSGLPPPQVPMYTLIPSILGKTFSLAIVASAVLISLAKIFASKHNYKIDSNQELIALGLANVFGSFFLCIPTTGALGRSAVQESVGGSTQMVSLISALIVLIVLLALGKYMEPLPRTCLGCIIMVALLSMLKQVLDVRRMWHVSLIDASIFLVTLLATLLLDVDIGLAVGVLYSLLTFAFRMQYGHVEVLGKVHGSSDDMTGTEESMVEEYAGVRVFKLYGPLYSGNAESFTTKILRTINGDLVLLPKSNPKVIARRETVTSEIMVELDVVPSGIAQRQNNANGNTGTVPTVSLLPVPTPIRMVVIDFSTITFVDIVGAERLILLAKECKKKSILLMCAGCSDRVRDTLVLAGLPTFLPPNSFRKNVLDAIDEMPS